MREGEELTPIPSEGPPGGRTMEEWGGYLFTLNGCGGCHGAEGLRGVGGALSGIIGQRRHFTDGREARVDEAYLRQSIVAPRRDVVLGFQATMPRYELRGPEVDALVAYIVSLSPPAPRPRP